LQTVELATDEEYFGTGAERFVYIEESGES
jgi:hypothetical protein